MYATAATCDLLGVLLPDAAHLQEEEAHFIAVLEGSLILAKAKQDMRIVEKNLLHFKRYLKALFGG